MQIRDLIPDIQKLVVSKEDWFNVDLGRSFGEDVSKRMQDHFKTEERVPTLRLSQMGPRCPKALWYSIHEPSKAEALPPSAKIKYAYGHILEALVITLAKAAGHKVEGEQDEVYVDGVRGHRDCVIDGCIVDVKSSSSFGFTKFKDGSIRDHDDFGYLDQLDGYLVGSLEDPLVTVKDKAYLLAIDKTLGHMCLYEHYKREDAIHNRIRDYKAIVAMAHPPRCECITVADGKSGNIRLNTKASYNVFKHCCFPNLRTFLYASGPVYLTHVVRKPDVTEVDKSGKIVYH